MTDAEVDPSAYFYTLKSYMKNPFANYSKDTMAKVTAIFILVILIITIYLQPTWWPWVLLIAVGYTSLFYFERNNP